MKTDDEIRHDIKAELEWEARLNGSHIHTEVNNGHVILTGTCDSYPRKINAEKAVRRVKGVKAVVNNLEVEIPYLYKKPDEQIKKAIENAITWNSAIDENRIKVSVDKGRVTLEGNVSWEYQRSKARLLAEDITGVTEVINLIEVKPLVPTPAQVLKNIIEAFKRNFYLDPEKIKVEVNGSTAKLSGTVRTLSEKTAAEKASWSAPGITEVDNQLAVNYPEGQAA